MKVELVRAKIHRATVTHADVDYEGSIEIDANLMRAADILKYKAVHIWNITNGSRLVTYALEGEPDSGHIKPNGAAAIHNRPGDLIIIASFARMESFEAHGFEPNIVLVDAENKITQIKPATVMSAHGSVSIRLRRLSDG